MRIYEPSDLSRRLHQFISQALSWLRAVQKGRPCSPLFSLLLTVYVIFLENDKIPKNSFVTIALTPPSDVLSEPPLNSEGEWRKRLNNINSWLCGGISPEAVRFILAGSRKSWHFLKLPSMSLEGRFPNTLSKLITTITLYRASWNFVNVSRFRADLHECLECAFFTVVHYYDYLVWCVVVWLLNLLRV